MLKEWRSQVIHTLGVESDQVEIYRAQGVLKAVNFLLGLRDDAKNYVKGIQDKTMKSIGDRPNAEPVQKRV